MFNKNRIAMMKRRSGKRVPDRMGIDRAPVAGATPVRGGGGVPMQGPGGKIMRPERPEKKKPIGMKGGGLARKGAGAAYAKGGMVRGAGCATKGKKISSKMG